MSDLCLMLSVYKSFHETVKYNYQGNHIYTKKTGINIPSLKSSFYRTFCFSVAVLWKLAAQRQKSRTVSEISE